MIQIPPESANSLTALEQQNLPLRFVIFHLHPTSARLRYLKFDSGHVCAPKKLPVLTEVLDRYKEGAGPSVHPQTYLRPLCRQLAVAESTLSIAGEFRCWVDTPSGALPIYLARVQLEQPFDAPDGCDWIELPDCLLLSNVEIEIMRRAYQWLLE